MRMKGRFHEVSQGVWSCYPQTREDALQQQIVFFQPLPVTNPCPRPGHEPGSIVYSKTGIHRCCALRDSIDAYNNAVRRGEPTDPNTAVRLGYDYYWQADPGKICGHVGMTTIDGKCYECKMNNPRQVAIRNGEKWYDPDKPCPRCKTLAPRRVDNAQCKGCRETQKEPAIQDIAPDLVMDKETAAANGFKVYRTGKPCRRGHKGWRYISSNNCIDCLKS